MPALIVPEPDPASSPQKMLPAPSVSNTPAPVQLRIVFKVRPPAPTYIPPSKVEVAVEDDVSLPVMLNAPLTVDEAVARKPL